MQKTNLEKDRIFIVPGNHDVYWDKVGKNAHKLCDFKNQNDINTVIGDDNDRKGILSRFDNYKTFINEFYSVCRDPIIFDDDNHYFSKRITVCIDDRTLKIKVMGLNSAWISGNNDEIGNRIKDQGYVVIGKKQVSGAIHKFNDKEGIDVRIVMMHHPISFLKEFDQEDVKNCLQNSCDFILSGHLHRSGFVSSISPLGRSNCTPAGALYQGEGEINSYNYVKYDPVNRKGKICFRKYSSLRNEWISDIELTGEKDVREYDFDIGTR